LANNMLPGTKNLRVHTIVRMFSKKKKPISYIYEIFNKE
jgi:hypothetical protein